MPSPRIRSYIEVSLSTALRNFIALCDNCRRAGPSEVLAERPVRWAGRHGRGGPLVPAPWMAGGAQGLWADDQHRAGSVADDVVGDAADEQAPERTAAVGADDDQVDRFAQRRVHDRWPGLAFPDEEGHAGALPPAAKDQVLRRQLTRRPPLVHPE